MTVMVRIQQLPQPKLFLEDEKHLLLITLSFYRNISMGRRRRLERCKCRFESCFLYKTDVVEKRYFVGHRFESGSRPA